MGQQVRHLTRMCADDHSDRVTGYSDGVRNDDVQRRPPGQLDQLLGLTQAGGSTGGENQDMWSRCHEVTGHLKGRQYYTCSPIGSELRSMAIRPVLKMGDPVLLQVAKPVERFDTPELRDDIGTRTKR